VKGTETVEIGGDGERVGLRHRGVPLVKGTETFELQPAQIGLHRMSQRRPPREGD